MGNNNLHKRRLSLKSAIPLRNNKIFRGVAVEAIFLTTMSQNGGIKILFSFLFFNFLSYVKKENYC